MIAAIKEGEGATALVDRDESRIGELVEARMATFIVKHTLVRRETFNKGFGVWVALAYAGDDEPNPDEPVAFDAGIVEIRPEDCTYVGGVMCSRIGENAYVPVENFGGDESDLSADRYFPTYAEALNHCHYIKRRLVANGLRDES